MNAGAIVLLLVAAVPSSQLSPGTDSGSHPIWWSPSLTVKSVVDARRQLDGPLGDEFSVRVNGAQRILRTCRDFLAVVDKKVDAETENDWDILWAQGTRCLALSLLVDGRPAIQSHLARFRWEKVTLSDLPPELGFAISPEEEGTVRRAAAACESLGKIDPALRITKRKDDMLSVRAPTWTGSITLYARGDFDHDGIEDLLVERDAAVRRGSATLSSLFVVTRKTDEDCLRVARRIH